MNERCFTNVSRLGLMAALGGSGFAIGAMTGGRIATAAPEAYCGGFTNIGCVGTGLLEAAAVIFAFVIGGLAGGLVGLAVAGALLLIGASSSVATSPARRTATAFEPVSAQVDGTFGTVDLR